MKAINNSKHILRNKSTSTWYQQTCQPPLRREILSLARHVPAQSSPRRTLIRCPQGERAHQGLPDPDEMPEGRLLSDNPSLGSSFYNQGLPIPAASPFSVQLHLAQGLRSGDSAYTQKRHIPEGPLYDHPYLPSKAENFKALRFAFLGSWMLS